VTPGSQIERPIPLAPYCDQSGRTSSGAIHSLSSAADPSFVTLAKGIREIPETYSQKLLFGRVAGITEDKSAAQPFLPGRIKWNGGYNWQPSPHRLQRPRLPIAFRLQSNGVP
jgi:hypothetical protein